MPPRNFQTRAIHTGELEQKVHGAVLLPVFQSASFEFSGESTGYDDVGYIRLNNTPNHQVLNAKLANLEGAEAAMVTSSGMSAISTTLLALLSPGDHLLAQGCMYGGTHSFVTKDLARFGVSVDFIDGRAPESWESSLRSNTRAVYVESISNPLTEVGAHDEMVAFAKAHGLVSLIDNTFASPLNFRPVERGFDLSLNSATKYLNGHGDLVAGLVSGSRPLIQKVTHLLNHLGGCLDPHACSLLHRGIKTLALRMHQHQINALALAQFLEEHPAVQRVHYPGLPSHPDHQRAKSLMPGHGGVLSFELAGGQAAAEGLFTRLALSCVAPSLGSTETLISRPATTSHASMSAEARARLGISDGLVRVACGIEHQDDLLEDFAQGLPPA